MGFASVVVVLLAALAPVVSVVVSVNVAQLLLLSAEYNVVVFALVFVVLFADAATVINYEIPSSRFKLQSRVSLPPVAAVCVPAIL